MVKILLHTQRHTMKPDISTSNDINKLVAVFYDTIKSDTSLQLLFSKKDIDPRLYLSRSASFLENVLFYTGDYAGDPLIAEESMLRKLHSAGVRFDKLLELFCATVDKLFRGPNADRIKGHARSISSVLQRRTGA